MDAVNGHPKLELQIILGASTLLDRYGDVEEQIESDGFRSIARIHMIVEGETPVTMAKSVGVGLIELPTIFDRCKPDIVVVVGDRFETMAVTLSASFMNIPIAHTMGGEVTGTIDESIRHAITKFSHIHFPATKGARDRIIKLGERPDDVYLVGCPRIDLVARVLEHEYSAEESVSLPGVGSEININQPFILMSQHPVTTEYDDAEAQIWTTLKALKEIDLPTIVLWPNADAGSNKISRGIRRWREQQQSDKMRFVKHLAVEDYIRLMKHTACLVGNSSSGIREGVFIGTPTVNIGSRQNARERGSNVVDVPAQKTAILDAVSKQLSHGSYESENIYGDGMAGQRIAEVLSSCNWKLQKQITY